MMVIFMPSIDESSVKYVAYPFDLPVAITETDTMLGPGTSDAPGALLLLIPVEDVNGRHDCLLVQKHHARAFVNGLPVLSATLLHDRDEISLGPLPESRFYFSDEAYFLFMKAVALFSAPVPKFTSRRGCHLSNAPAGCGTWNRHKIPRIPTVKRVLAAVAPLRWNLPGSPIRFPKRASFVWTTTVGMCSAGFRT